MMLSLYQTAVDVAQTAGALHLIEGVGFTGLLGLGWKLLRVFHAGKVETGKRFGDLRGDIRVLTETVKNHIERTPTEVDCAEHTNKLTGTIAAANNSLREEVAVMMLEHGHDVRALETRVTDLVVKCATRRRNGAAT